MTGARGKDMKGKERKRRTRKKEYRATKAGPTSPAPTRPCVLALHSGLYQLYQSIIFTDGEFGP